MIGGNGGALEHPLNSWTDAMSKSNGRNVNAIHQDNAGGSVASQLITGKKARARR